MASPVCVDLFCGQFWGSYLHPDGTWHSPFVDEGWRVIGFDLMDVSKEFGEAMPLPAGCELRIRDVLSLRGSELADADLIVASPPCTEPSYRAMPWKRAKALNAAGPPVKFIELFKACFRIQREAVAFRTRSGMMPTHVPLIVENVVGAQRWCGRAAWHFGSYYLWGDVPALMPTTLKFKNPGFRFDDSGRSFQSESVKTTGQNWSRFRETGEVSPHWRLEGLKTVAHWYDGGAAAFGSKSTKRKLASAMIAKIPYPLALHIAQTFIPQQKEAIG